MFDAIRFIRNAFMLALRMEVFALIRGFVGYLHYKCRHEFPVVLNDLRST